MNLPFWIARRYLFSKKSTNAINIISGISVFGLSVGTAALILVLSVFNGFEELISGLFSNFNPDIKIEVKQGKFFRPDSSKIAQIKKINGVLHVSKTIEEVAIFEYKGHQNFGRLKGVDDEFVKVTEIDSTIREGVYELQEGDRDFAVVGAGMYNKLSINVDDYFSTLTVYMAKRKRVGPLADPLKRQYLYPAGIFSIQQDFDSQYILSSLPFAQKLLDLRGQVSFLELKLDPSAAVSTIVKEVEAIMGEDFVVKDRYKQDEAFLKLMNIEKWMSFAILFLTLLLVAFNLIGSLWMIVMDKKKDIAILQSMGGTKSLIRNIFLGEGLLLTLVGMLSGFFIALVIYFIQINYGIVPIPDGFVIDTYPISIRLSDFVIVAITVIFIGLIASFPPALRAMRISGMVREA